MWMRKVSVWLPVVSASWHPAPLCCLLATTAVATLLGSLTFETNTTLYPWGGGRSSVPKEWRHCSLCLHLCPNSNTLRSALSMVPPAVLHTDGGFWIAPVGCEHIPPRRGLPHSCQSFQRRTGTQIQTSSWCPDTTPDIACLSQFP